MAQFEEVEEQLRKAAIQAYEMDALLKVCHYAACYCEEQSRIVPPDWNVVFDALGKYSENLLGEISHVETRLSSACRKAEEVGFSQEG